MDNEKSVYEILQEQIDSKDKIINKLIKTNIITILILAVVMIVFTLSYFFSDYEYFTNSNNTTISGDENKIATDNNLDNKSKIEE